MKIRKAAVLGGGPSLPEQLELLPEGVTLFGVNHHASLLVDCDYICFNDPWGADLVAGLPGVKISRHADLADIHVDVCAISAILAVEAARRLGFNYIYLCGMDISGRHFHDDGPTNINFDDHMRQWRQLDPTGLHALAGPLTELFGGEPYQEIEILEKRSLVIDGRRSVNFVPGAGQVFPREVCRAALAAGIATQEKSHG